MWMGLGHEEDDHHKLSWADGPKTPSWWIYWWYWWSLPKRNLGWWNLANPMNWAILIKVQQEEEEIRKKDDSKRVFFMNRRDSPPDERRVFHYQNVWFPDTFINYWDYWVIIASLSHFDPQFHLDCVKTHPIPAFPVGLVWFGRFLDYFWCHK